MTAHISKPFVHIEDSNGNPYVSGKLYVYDVGTTNLKSIYSDTGLSASLVNPMTSDAAGNFARAYVASGTYKLRAETSTGTLIWEIDYIDTGLTSGSGALAISAGGTGSTTAAAARTALGAAAQTDVDDLASDVATLTSSLQSIVSVPQGRLTLFSGQTVPASDVAAGTSVYYTPFIGNQIPIWDNTQYNLSTFAELTLAMNANHLASTVYDVFIWKESGVVTIGTGPAWSSSATRGSGAGTTEIERVGGLWVNAYPMTARNGATTYTVGENLATYVGSIYMDGSNGQISSHITVGQLRRPGPWNAYNRVRRELLVRDATASWTYSTNTIRPSNNDANNSMFVLCGLPEEPIMCQFRQKIGDNVASTSGEINIGIGVGSTTTMSGTTGDLYINTATITSEVRATVVAHHTIMPILGVSFVYALETVPTTTGTEVLYGGAKMVLSANWGA